MSKETEENKEDVMSSFDINNMFNTDTMEKQMETDDEFDASEFDGVNFDANKKEEEENEDDKGIDFNKEEENEEEENEDDKGIDFEGTDEEKLDFEAFNKKFNTEFKDEAELRAALNKKEDVVDQAKVEEEYNQAVEKISNITPLMTLDDKELMKRRIQWLYLQDKKDLTDPDVQIDVETDLQELIDNQLLDVKATMFRNDLQKVLDNANGIKNSVETTRTEAKTAQEKQEKEELQNHLVNLYNSKSFFGVEIDKKTIQEVYKDVTSEEFIKRLQSDKGAIAELALMSKLKERIFKKASGLTYNDGLKAVLDEYKANAGKNKIVNAQKRGTSGSPENSLNLIDEIVQ